MIRSHAFLISAVVCCSGLAPAQEKPTFGDSDRVAIEQMYGRYLQAFFKKDYATIREYVQPPFVVFTGGEMRILESIDAVMMFYKNAREPLDEQNYDHSEVVKTRITPLTADRALVSKAFRRYSKDGTLLGEEASVYILCKTSSAWKIRGALWQELKYFGEVY